MTFVCKACGTVNTPQVVEDDWEERICGQCKKHSFVMYKKPDSKQWLCERCFYMDSAKGTAAPGCFHSTGIGSDGQ